MIVERLDDLTPLLGMLSQRGHDISALARADEVKRPLPGSRRMAQNDAPDLFKSETAGTSTDTRDDIHRVLPKGRNFH